MEGLDFDDFWDRFKKSCKEADAIKLENRLECLILLYAYVEKEFQERFPKEFAKYEMEIEMKNG